MKYSFNNLPSYEQWHKVVKKYDSLGLLTENEISTAYNNLTLNGCFIMIISGKLAAGKDSVAPILAARINKQNTPIKREAFADPLKRETSNVLQNVYTDPDDVIRILKKYGMPDSLIPLFSEVILETAEDFKEKQTPVEDVNTFVRSSGSRSILQIWGTDFRRSQDDIYWVRLAVVSAIKSLAKGSSVYVTDARFPSEVQSFIDLGGLALRLDVSEETQNKRLFERDGLTLTDDLRFHKSETALDDFPNFHLRLDANDSSPDELVETTLSSLKL